MRNHKQVGSDSASGAALVGAVLALTAAAAMVATLFIVAGSAGRVAGGSASDAGMRSFALGLISACPEVADFMAQQGAYEDGSGELPDNSVMTFTVLDVTAATPGLGELAIGATSGTTTAVDLAPWAEDLQTGDWVPDVRVVYGSQFVGFMDIDHMQRHTGDGGGGGPKGGFWKEFGVYERNRSEGGGGGGGEAATELNYAGIFRCFAYVVGQDGRTYSTFGYVPKYY